MDERDGARNALIQSTRQGIKLMRERAEASRKLARAYGASLSADVSLIPDDVLREYEEATREAAESDLGLADAIRAELDSR